MVNVADNSSTLGPDLPYNDENLRLHRYHCMTWIYNSTVMIIGGYSSEEKTLGDTWVGDDPKVTSIVVSFDNLAE